MDFTYANDPRGYETHHHVCQYHLFQMCKWAHPTILDVFGFSGRFIFHKFLKIHEKLRYEIIFLMLMINTRILKGLDNELGAHKGAKDLFF